MKEIYTIKCFIKFGSEENLLDLQKNGTVYMNTIDTFRNIEDQELRGDSYEGISKIWNYPAAQFEIPSINYKGNYLHLHFCEKYEKVLGNIYSLFCVSSFNCPDPMKFRIDARMKRFGSHFLLIKDNPRFLQIIREKLNAKKIIYREGFIEYYAKDEMNGAISVLQKPMEFAYQKEFRFFAYQKKCKPLILKLGNLKSITELFSVHAIDTFELTRN